MIEIVQYFLVGAVMAGILAGLSKDLAKHPYPLICIFIWPLAVLVLVYGMARKLIEAAGKEPRT